MARTEQGQELMTEDEFTSTDAYTAVGGEVRLPPAVVRTFAEPPAVSRAEREAAPIVVEMLGLFANHGIPLTDELRAAAGDLAFAAVLTRNRPNTTDREDRKAEG